MRIELAEVSSLAAGHSSRVAVEGGEWEDKRIHESLIAGAAPGPAAAAAVPRVAAWRNAARRAPRHVMEVNREERSWE